MSEGPLLAAFKKRENIKNKLISTQNRAAFNSLLPQWTEANGNLQKALLEYVPNAVLATNMSNNALNGIIKGLAKNKYEPFIQPIIQKFKGLKTRYQNSSAARPNYSGSLNSILQVLSNSGVNVSAARGVVTSNANMKTKFDAVQQTLTAASAALKNKNARMRAGTALNKAQITALDNQLVKERQNRVKELSAVRAEATLARANATKARLEAAQHRNSARLAEGMAREANKAVAAAQARLADKNREAVAAKEAAAKAAENAAKASAANKAEATRKANVAAKAAAEALKAAQNAHAANKAAVIAAANAEKNAIKRNAAAAQKLHETEAIILRARLAGQKLRALAAEKKTAEATAKARANLANRNAQVAAAKAQVEAEATKVAAAETAKAAAEAAAQAARNANAANKAALTQAAAKAAQNANEARKEANAAKTQHATEKANLEARAAAANASAAEKEAARAALNAEKKALQTEKNKLEFLRKVNRAKVSASLATALAYKVRAMASEKKKVNQGSQAGASSTVINKLPTGLPRAQSLTAEANRQNWNKFTRNAGKYIRQIGQWKSGQFNKKIARGIKNNRNNPLAQEVLNAEWNVHKANTPNKINAARARYTKAREAWETSKNNITKQQGFYNAYKTFKYIKNYAKDTSLNTVIKRAAGAAIGNSQFETNSKKTVNNTVINSITNTNIRNRLKEMIKIRDYRTFLSNNTIKKRANLKQQYNDAVKYLSNKNFNFSTFETKMKVLQNAASAPVPAPSRPAPPPPAAAYTKTINRIYHTTGPKNFAGIGSVWTDKNGYGFILEPGTKNYRPIMSRVATNVTYHPNKQNKTKEVKVKAYQIGNASTKPTKTWSTLKNKNYLASAQKLSSGVTIRKGNVRMVHWENKLGKKMGNGASINNIGGSKYIMVNGKYRPVIGYTAKNQKGRRVATISLNNRNVYGGPKAQRGISNLLRGK